MDKKNLTKNKVLSGFLWKFLERVGAQTVNIIVSIALARIIEPSEYGVIALTAIFITIGNVFVESGLPTALIQKKDSDDADFSTVFYFNVFISVVIYIALFIIAPIIANFYKNNVLTDVIRVLGIIIIIAGIKSIQNAYVSKHMIFKKFFICTFGGTIFSGILGIIMAYNNYGVWALVFQQLSNTLIDTVLLWVFVKWRPKKIFSLSKLKKLYSFGWKLFMSALLDNLYNNLRGLIIGRKYTSSDLAFYDKANQFPNLIVNNINTSIDSVLLPAMSIEQNNQEKIKHITRKAIKYSSYLMWPLMVGLAVCAPSLVKIILTDKWMDCVVYLRILCFSYAIWPIHTANLNAIKAIGRSDLVLKIEVMKKIIGIISIFFAIPFGVLAIAISLLIIGPINAIINAYPNQKILNYSIKEQVIDILPYFILACVMGLVIIPIAFCGLNEILTLFLQFFVGAIFYIITSIVFKIDVFFEFCNIIVMNIKKIKVQQ
ncbi:MAG: lipopolysaccharide biosynthesis protein [Clostridia bacterium]|nr:lipopolysaccharide biosynthesis protein [Clostridia bacterium]